MERNFYDSAIQAVRDFVTHEHNGNVASAKAALGIKTDSLDKWLRGDRSPQLEAIGPILDTIGFSVEKRTTIRRLAENSPTIVIEGKDLRDIPVFGMAGAGPAFEGDSSAPPSFKVRVPNDFMFACDYALVVDGRSMEPTIRHESIIGVLENTKFVGNELYVARIPYEGYVVKRVAVDRESGEFVFKSDNPNKSNYPDFREPIESATKIIMGRVIWALQST